MSVKFTDSQLNAINAQGTVLVAAAAGSGKTAVLVERIIRRFCDEETPLMADRALIVTFTNAAADELKSKIETALNDKLEANPDSDLLKRQNMAFKRASICTIDSFCISLLRENFNLLDISRDFKINDSTNVDADIDDLLDRFIFNKFKENDKVLSRLSDALKSGYDEWYLKKIIKTIYSKSRSMPYPEKWLDSILKEYTNQADDFINSQWAEFVFERLIESADNAMLTNRKLLEYCKSGELINVKYLPAVEARVAFLNQLLYLAQQKDWDGCIDSLSTYKYTVLRSNYSKDPMVSAHISEANSTIKETIEFLQKNFDARLHEIVYILNAFTAVLNDVIQLIKQFNNAVFENSRKNNAYTFEQIEHLALQLFSMDNSTATDSFNSMYDAILVDEYQDTSNLQDELFAVLSRQKKELFMVGDVKQSIYGFRNANPDNFLKKKNEFPIYTSNENPCKVLLTGNFRSRKGICEFINYLFTAYMTKANADMDYDEEEQLVPLAPYLNNGENSDVEIKLLEKENDMSVTEYEANYVADYILKTLDKEPFIDNGDDTLRRAMYKDFVLLMRSPNSRVNTFVKVFKERGIPLNCPSESFKDASEIRVALSFLKAIDNTNDSISLLSVLKSPLYNFSDSEIAEIMSQDRYVSLYGNLTALSESNQKVKYFLTQYDSFRMYYAVLPLEKLINKLFSETFFMEIYSSLENGTIRKSNLRMLLELSGKFNNEAGKGIRELVSYIEKDSSNSLAVNILNTENAVQITSIHKSKGLQYPICILCSSQTRFNILDTTSQIVCDDNFGASFSFYDKKYNSLLSPISSKFISGNMKSKLYKEELRLLYVALTRAKEKLVIVSTAKDIDKYLNKATKLSLNASVSGLPFIDGSLMLGNSYSDWIVSAALYHADGIAYRRNEEDYPCSHYNCSFDISIEQTEFIENIRDIEEEDNEFISVSNIDSIISYEYPYQAVNSVPAKTSVTDILKKDISPEIAFKARPSFISEGGLTAAEKGTATHKFMEACNFQSAVEDLESEIERLYEWEFISEKEAQAINRESVKAFFNSPAYGLIIKAKEVLKEYRFISKIPAYELNEEIKLNSHEYSIVQGVADCVLIYDDGLVIIDYKTDSSTSAEYYKKEYSRQLLMYSKALSQIFKKPVLKCIIYSFKMQQCIDI